MPRTVRSLTLLAVTLALLAIAPSADAQRKGGVLRVGNLGEPPALDPHVSTTALAETVSNHIY